MRMSHVDFMEDTNTVMRHKFLKKAVDYFENVFKIKMSVSDQLDFLNLWYVMIVINDVLIIVGTVSKITIEFRDFDNSLFTLTGIMLGMGALLVYVGVLRYFGFFSQYNGKRLSRRKSYPTRSAIPALGTNPLSVGAAGTGGDSFLLDMATTTVAVGKQLCTPWKILIAILRNHINRNE
uniref:XK-related protein n=1 Tax=Heterorhabditis bacteriophora TaxID=37862 RepID=A0A1I7XP57_HETBA